MASRMAECESLAARCRKVGWRVDRGPDGYRIYTNDNQIHTIHLTPSDQNAIVAIRRKLNKSGLSQLEKAQNMARITETRTRAQIAAEAAEKKGKELAAKAALTKAAGPYLTEPETIPLEWFVTPHHAPWMRWAWVTPEIASYVLDNHNTDNRYLDKKSTVSKYKNIIAAGNWHLTHQGVAFDTRGLFQDGQHRFEAVRQIGDEDESFEGVPFAVFVGMPEENFKVIDEGKLRTAAQLFGRTGEKNRSTIQTAVRLVHYINDIDARKAVRLYLPNQLVIDEFEADAQNFRESVNYAHQNFRKCHISAASLAASRYLLYKANGHDNSYVDAFFYGFTEGIIPGTRLILDDTDPRAVLRRRFSDLKLQRGKRTALSQVGMVIQTWNNCILSREPRTLVFTDNDPIPQILQCQPGEGAAPKAFRSVVG